MSIHSQYSTLTPGVQQQTETQTQTQPPTKRTGGWTSLTQIPKTVKANIERVATGIAIQVAIEAASNLLMAGLQSSTTSRNKLPPPRLPVSPEVLMLRLRALMGKLAQTMAEVTDLSIDKQIEVKKEKADQLLQKVMDLAKKLKDALDSWVSKLPGWLAGVATAIATCVMAAIAIAAVASTGGAALPLVIAALALTISALYSTVSAFGTIGWQYEHRHDENAKDMTFDFPGMEKALGMSEGSGKLLQGIVGASLPDFISGICQWAGTDDPKKLMIIESVFTALTLALTIYAMWKYFPKIAEQAGKVHDIGKVVATGAGAAKGAAMIGQAAVTDKTSKAQAKAKHAEAEQERARITFELANQILKQLIEYSTHFFEPDQSVNESVVRALRSISNSNSELLAPSIA